jgi:hypothetical protein
MDVHRAARIAATAHGGQVVLSGITWQPAEPGLPAELSARDLGLHRPRPAEQRRSSSTFTYLVDLD